MVYWKRNSPAAGWGAGMFRNHLIHLNILSTERETPQRWDGCGGGGVGLLKFHVIHLNIWYTERVTAQWRDGGRFYQNFMSYI